MCACMGLNGCASGCNTAGKAGDKPARITFLVLFLFSAVTAIVLRISGASLFRKHTNFVAHNCISDDCVGNQIIYRFSFGNAIFFALMAAIAPFCLMVHRQLWQAKIPFYLLLVVGSFFLPEELFEGFEVVARYMSTIFLILQVIILVEFAYDVHESLTASAEEADKELEGGVTAETTTCEMLNKYRIVYLILILMFSLFWLIGSILLFTTFKCPFTRKVTAVTMSFGLLSMVGASLSKDGGLLPGATVAAYCTWLTFSALSSNDDLDCNTFAKARTNTAMWSGIIVAILSMVYTSYSMANNFIDAFTCCLCQKNPENEEYEEGKRSESEDFRSK